MNLNFSGVWKGNLEKSKLLGAAPKAVLAKINHADPELVVETVITKMDDSEDRVLFRGLTNGEEVANPVHGIPVRSRSNWVGTDLLIESWMNLGGREEHFRDFWSLSGDGQTLTMEHFRDFWSLSGDGQTLTMEHRDDDLAGQITLLERTHAH